MTHVKFSLKKVGEIFQLKQDFLKKEMKHEHVHADTWRIKKDEWMDDVESDVLPTAFSYARYS